MSWTSKKIKNVVTSVIEAEAVALVNGVKEVVYIRELLSELLVGNVEDRRIFIGAYCDNQSLIKSILCDLQPVDLQLRKHVAFLREKSRGENIYISWVKAEFQVADQLTKERSNTSQIFINALNGTLPQVRSGFSDMIHDSSTQPSFLQSLV